MKIIIFTRSYDNVLGGMERQLGSIAGLLISLGHEVHLVSLDIEKPKSFFSNANFTSTITISTSNPNKSSKITERFMRQKRLTKILKELKPDLGIAFMTGSYFYSRVPTIICRVPLVLAERNSPQIYKLTSARRYRWAYFASMVFANRIIVQFERYSKGYPRILRNKISAIPNEIPKPKNVPEIKKNRQEFFYAGRLSFQKQLDKLILGFIEFHNDFPHTSLEIIGEGEERAKLEALIIQHNSDDYIKITAPHENLSDVFEEKDVLCLLSLWEGFPNILGESLAHGIPGLGFSNTDGVRDLLSDGWNGWLAEDSGKTSDISLLLKRTQLRGDNVSSQHCIHSVNKYNSDSIRQEWQTFLSRFEPL